MHLNVQCHKPIIISYNWANELILSNLTMVNKLNNIEMPKIFTGGKQ